MMARNVFETETHQDRLEEILLDRSYSSIYDITDLYGRLHSTYLSLKYEGVGVDQKYIEQRLTPEARPDYFEQGIGMVSVPVNISENTVSFGTAGDVVAAEADYDMDSIDPTAPLYAEPVDRKKLLRVGYSRQDSRASGHNMSLAHDITDKSPAKCAGYIRDLFTQWLQSDMASEVAEEHPDGDLINRLASLESEDLSKLEESVKAEFENRFPSGFTGVLSLRILTENGDRFKYPGEFEVLNEVTKRRWVANQMRSYSEAKDSSGTATDFVTGEQGEVFGVSDSPLERHQGKMAESFPDLSPDESWRNRPLSSETAFAIISGSSVVKEFVHLLRDDTRLYVIPYLSNPNPGEAVALYDLARKAMDDDGQIVSVISDELTDRSSRLYDSGVQLYYSVVYEPGRKSKILIEEPSVSVQKMRSIAEAHTELLGSALLVSQPNRLPLFPSPPYGRTNSQTDGDEYDGSEYLMSSMSDAVFSGLLSGGYFASTFFDRKADADDDNYGANDPWTTATRQCLGPDTRLNPEWLMDQYVPRLENEQRSSFGEDDLPVPDSLLTRQYVQYQALARAGVLGISGQEPGDAPPLTQPVQIDTMTDDSNPARQMAEEQSFENREQRLNKFIEAHPALDKNEERQGAFLLGALVGRLAAYQTSPKKDLSRTVMRQHPINSLTLQRFSTTLNQVLDKNAVYSEEDENVNSIMNTRYVERLNDIVHSKPPTEWDLSISDLRMHYGLGLSYGRSDTSIGTYNDDESNSE
ncbi:CRISPR-associated protein Csh1 [Halococcoides cellulosivorans]|uniref:CRISPR-associated protein Csh1 n=2 Tax=Halococcoides cellulosivorans TaxID=1679096 RepID=A0A2R4WYU2_9EURY|nr:CRISPR-associated protein Csh1 [Halococcoides cellulosivorans]